MNMDYIIDSDNHKAKVKAANEKAKRGTVTAAVIFIWVCVILLLLAGAAGVYAISKGWLGKIPEIEELQNPINKYASRVYSDDGVQIGTWSYATQNRLMVPYDSIPQDLVNALVATEDERFFEHSGIDFQALGRAIVKTVFMGDKSAGGGSTITQQLAKQLYTDVAKDMVGRMMQKPIEWYIAVQLEKYYTKEEIIAMYLNQFDFLYNAVGIKNAAYTYFGKSQYDLTLSECATLVGMCKNPSLFNPIRSNERCLERRNIVLEQMLKNGYISKETCEATQQQPIDVSLFRVTTTNEGPVPYMREYLRRILMAERPVREQYASWQYQQFYDDSLAWEQDPLYGWCNKNRKKNGENYNIYTDGLKIYTTIDSRMQKYAEQAMREHVARYLQPSFDRLKGRYANFPYIGVSKSRAENLIRRAMKQSERWRVLQDAGYSEDKIVASFNTKTHMTILKYASDGTCYEEQVEMTPRDSILHYKKFLRSAMMAMDPQTGYVRAYVGGLDFKHFQYDNVMGGGRRQVGSTIKPYLYSLAILNGENPHSPISTAQFSAGGWHPKGGVGAGHDLASALAASSNQASARLIDRYGPKNFINLLHQYGIRTQNIDPTLSLCLGVCDISVGEMVSGYSAFANQGLRTEPLLVTRIEDASGNIVAQFTPRTNEVLSKENAYQMVLMLRGVIDHGTGRALRSTIHADMGGKTGTTNSHVDAWFMGFTPHLVVGCWVGGDENDIHFDSMSVGQGAKAALPIYHKFMNSVYHDGRFGVSQSDKFVEPEDFDPYANELDDLRSFEHLGEHDAVEDVSEGIDDAFQ